jgi:hypothetical protein
MSTATSPQPFGLGMMASASSTSTATVAPPMLASATAPSIHPGTDVDKEIGIGGWRPNRNFIQPWSDSIKPKSEDRILKNEFMMD